MIVDDVWSGALQLEGFGVLWPKAIGSGPLFGPAGEYRLVLSPSVEAYVDLASATVTAIAWDRKGGLEDLIRLFDPSAVHTGHTDAAGVDLELSDMGRSRLQQLGLLGLLEALRVDARDEPSWEAAEVAELASKAGSAESLIRQEASLGSAAIRRDEALIDALVAERRTRLQRWIGTRVSQLASVCRAWGGADPVLDRLAGHRQVLLSDADVDGAFAQIRDRWVPFVVDVERHRQLAGSTRSTGAPSFAIVLDHPDAASLVDPRLEVTGTHVRFSATSTPPGLTAQPYLRANERVSGAFLGVSPCDVDVVVSGELTLPPGARAEDLVFTLTTREHARSKARGTLGEAVDLGMSAIRAEYHGDVATSVDLWRSCAGSWSSANDERRAAIALLRASRMESRRSEPTGALDASARRLVLRAGLDADALLQGFDEGDPSRFVSSVIRRHSEE